MKRKTMLAMGLLLLAVATALFPRVMLESAGISRKYAWEMLKIFPAILALMGLADVWVPKKAINQYLGEQSGAKGVLLAILLGTLPTGPVYIAFPIAAELLRKKAGVANVMIFLGVWASLKIPQIGVEIQFLGAKFASLRFILTLSAILATSFLMAFLDKKYAQAAKSSHP